MSTKNETLDEISEEHEEVEVPGRHLQQAIHQSQERSLRLFRKYHEDTVEECRRRMEAARRPILEHYARLAPPPTKGKKGKKK